MSNIVFQQASTTRMTTSKQHDNLGRLTSISSVPSASSAVSFDYAYNMANQRTAITNADGSYWLFGYDTLGQVTSGKRYWTDNTPVAGQQFEYGFDDIGNRKTAKAGGNASGTDLRSSIYNANGLNQYVSRTVPPYVEVQGTAATNATVTVNNQATYRKGEYFRKELGILNLDTPIWVGITNVAVVNDGANPDIVSTNQGHLFLGKSPEVFSHDADGNMRTDGQFKYTWDGENRLVSVETAGSAVLAGAPKQKVTWIHDGKGRRIQQTDYTWDGNDWMVVSDLKFVSDGWRHIAELNATNNALVRSYAWGLDLSGSETGAGGVGGLLWLRSVANGAHFHAYDGNGNVTALVSAADGSVTANYEYDPFGNTLRATGAMAEENPFRFSSKRTHKTTDLVLYEYRPSKPPLGRWLTRDPIEESGGVNIFAFGANDLLGGFDLLGLKMTAYTAPSATPASVTANSIYPFDALTTGIWKDLEVKVGSLQPGGWPVTVKGVLYVTIEIVSSLPLGTQDEQGRSPLDHERVHESIHAKWWNQTKSDIDGVEGLYCRKKCAQIARDAAETIAAMNQRQAMAENATFDLTAYPTALKQAGQYSQKTLYVIQLKIEWNKLAINLNQLNNDWNSSKCTGPK